MHPPDSIGLATLTDLEDLVRLAAGLRDHLQQAEPSEAGFRTAFARLLRKREADFVLARHDRVAVGYVQLRVRDSAWHGGRQAEIEDVFVVPAARRSGVGQR